MSHLLSAGACAKNGQIWAQGSAFQRTSANSCFPSAGSCWESSLKLKHEKKKWYEMPETAWRPYFLVKWKHGLLEFSTLLLTDYPQLSWGVVEKQWRALESSCSFLNRSEDQCHYYVCSTWSRSSSRYCSRSAKVQSQFGEGNFHSGKWGDKSEDEAEDMLDQHPAPA